MIETVIIGTSRLAASWIRTQVEDTVLDLFKPCAEEVHVVDASFSTPKTTTDLVTDVGGDTPAKDTKSKKSILHSQPRANDFFFSFVVRKIPSVVSVRRQNKRVPGLPPRSGDECPSSGKRTQLGYAVFLLHCDFMELVVFLKTTSATSRLLANEFVDDLREHLKWQHGHQ